MEVEGKDDYEFDVEGLHISIRKGDRKNLSPHLAKTLEDHGVVDIVPMGSTALKKLIMEERSSPMPQELPEDFYELLRHKLAKEPDKDEAQRTRMLAKDLIKARIEKIYKISLQAKRPKIILQPEERIFLLSITSIMNKYGSQLLGENI